jgi:hypothetical protein
MGLPYYGTHAFFVESVEPFQEGNLVCLAEGNARAAVFLAAFCDKIREGRSFPKPRAVNGRPHV